MPTPGERVIAEFVTTTIELLENNEQQQRVPLRRRSDAHSMAVPKRLRFSNDDGDDNVTKIGSPIAILNLNEILICTIVFHCD
jgi:hypothetical protein